MSCRCVTAAGAETVNDAHRWVSPGLSGRFVSDRREREREREGERGRRSCDSAQVKHLKTGREAVGSHTRRVCDSVCLWWMCVCVFSVCVCVCVCVCVRLDLASCPVSGGVPPALSMLLPVVYLRSHHHPVVAALLWRCCAVVRRGAGRRSRHRETSSTASTRLSTPLQDATLVCRHSGRAWSTHWGGHAPWWTPPGSLRSSSGRWGGATGPILSLINKSMSVFSATCSTC